MSNEWDAERRKVLHRSGIAATVLLTGRGAFAQARKAEKKQEDVGPTEDLMREHGVLNRVLLLYDHFIAEIDRQHDLKPELVSGAATVIRRFVEDYHERQEEQFLFPRFEKPAC